MGNEFKKDTFYEVKKFKEDATKSSLFLSGKKYMSNFDNSSFLDLIQERLSNPVLFTLSWVFVTWNWQAFGWFLFEPIKFSRRITEFSQTQIEVYFLYPLIAGFALVFFGRALNNTSDYCSRFWDSKYAELLNKYKPDLYVKGEVYTKIQEEKKRLSDELDKYKTELEKRDKAQSGLIEKNKELSKQLSSANSKIADLNIEIQESKNKPIPKTSVKSQYKNDKTEQPQNVITSLNYQSGDPIKPNEKVYVKKNSITALDINLDTELITDSQRLKIFGWYDGDNSKPSIFIDTDPLKTNIDHYSFEVPIVNKALDLYVQLEERSVMNNDEFVEIESLKYVFLPKAA